MQISNSNLFFLTVNTGAALTNAYYNPLSFSLSFAVGVIFGIGEGLKQRVALVAIDWNEKAIEQIDESSKPIQSYIAPLKEQFEDSQVNEQFEKVSGYVQPLFRFFLYLSGYQSIYDTTIACLGYFDEQRKAIIRKLNPVPGKFLTLISVGALASNLEYMHISVISRIITISSGLPMGYAAGKFLMKNCDWTILKSESYENILLDMNS